MASDNSGFGGLSNTFRYYEFELDALDYTSPAQGGISPIDWPLFQIGGKRPLQNIAAIKILEVQIPFSFYIYETYNNTFLLNEVGNPGLVVTIPVGNYTVTEMLVVLADALNAASVVGTYTVTDNHNLMKLVITNSSGGTSSPFSLTFGAATDNGNNNPRYYLGFPGGSTSSLYSGTFDYIQSPNVYSITGPNYLFVNSDKIGNLTNLYLPKGAENLGYGNAGPQLAKIPITVNADGIIFWSDPDPGKWFSLESLPSLTEVDFYLTLGNTNHVVRMNGQNFSLKLGVLEDELSNVQNSLGSSRDRAIKKVRY